MLEQARGELFRHIGSPLLKLQGEGVVFPVIGLTVSYAGPARYDDLIAIALWITELGAVRLSFGFRISSAEGKTLVEGETRHVCVSLEEKPRRLPKEVGEALRPFFRTSNAP